MLAAVRMRGYHQNEPVRLPRDQIGSMLCMRQFAGEPGSPERAIAIRLADCDSEKKMATMLLNRMYSGRGYGSSHQLPATEESVTFTASCDEQVLGTLTLQVDSEDGLASDATFKEEMDSFRRMPGARLCELTKFAFDPSTKSRPIIASLFHIIYMYGSRRHECTDLFIEVNPRHVRFYEAMLGFQRVGPVKTNSSVAAPAQLMWLDVAEIARQIDRNAGDMTREGHSLYRYFFCKEEERAIYARMAALLGDDTALAQAA